MAQLMLLPLTISCSSKIQIGFTCLVQAHLVVPDKGPLNGCVCVSDYKIQITLLKNNSHTSLNYFVYGGHSIKYKIRFWKVIKILITFTVQQPRTDWPRKVNLITKMNLKRANAAKQNLKVVSNSIHISLHLLSTATMP